MLPMDVSSRADKLSQLKYCLIANPTLVFLWAHSQLVAPATPQDQTMPFTPFKQVDLFTSTHLTSAASPKRLPVTHEALVPRTLGRS